MKQQSEKLKEMDIDLLIVYKKWIKDVGLLLLNKQ
tara:strand:+ start:2486 stop:2590 length:105 start_codon:yes stop_codon:yes gene_type:complete